MVVVALSTALSSMAKWGLCNRLCATDTEPVSVSVAQAVAQGAAQAAAGVFVSPQPYFDQKSQPRLYFTVPVLARLFPAFAPPTCMFPLCLRGGSTSADVSRKISRIEVTSAVEYKYFPIEEISAIVYTKMAAAQK